MELLLVAKISSVALMVISIYLVDKLVMSKRIMKELGEALTVTSKAIEDNTVTETELKLLIREWKDVIKILLK